MAPSFISYYSTVKLMIIQVTSECKFRNKTLRWDIEFRRIRKAPCQKNREKRERAVSGSNREQGSTEKRELRGSELNSDHWKDDPWWQRRRRRIWRRRRGTQREPCWAWLYTRPSFTRPTRWAYQPTTSLLQVVPLPPPVLQFPRIPTFGSTTPPVCSALFSCMSQSTISVTLFCVHLFGCTTRNLFRATQTWW